MSEFFSGSKPDLISMKSINDLTANVFVASSQDIPINGRVTNQTSILKNPFNIKTFFLNYIKPNLLPVIIILIFIGFLVFRYVSKDEINETNEVNEVNEVNRGINQVNRGINQVNRNTSIEDFNPSMPINLQTDRMEYPTAGLRPPKYSDDPELEISIDEVFNKMKQKHGPQYDDVPDMYNCEFENPESRETIYMGNTSWISQPDGAKNVVYNENNLVSSTGDFVQFGIEKNRDANKSSFDDIAKRIFN